MGILARIKTILARHMLLIEFCHRCGVEQPFIWWCDSDEIWKEVTGSDNGIYCPRCFDVLALRKGVQIRWVAVLSYRFDTEEVRGLSKKLPLI